MPSPVRDHIRNKLFYACKHTVIILLNISSIFRQFFNFHASTQQQYQQLRPTQRSISHNFPLRPIRAPAWTAPDCSLQILDTPYPPNSPLSRDTNLYATNSTEYEFQRNTAHSPSSELISSLKLLEQYRNIPVERDTVAIFFSTTHQPSEPSESVPNLPENSPKVTEIFPSEQSPKLPNLQYSSLVQFSNHLQLTFIDLPFTLAVCTLKNNSFVNTDIIIILLNSICIFRLFINIISAIQPQQQQQQLQCRRQRSIFGKPSPPQPFLAASPDRRIKMHSLSCHQPAKFVPPQRYNTSAHFRSVYGLQSPLELCRNSI